MPTELAKNGSMIFSKTVKFRMFAKLSNVLSNKKANNVAASNEDNIMMFCFFIMYLFKLNYIKFT